jgi:hypothetical protein
MGSFTKDNTKINLSLSRLEAEAVIAILAEYKKWVPHEIKRLKNFIQSIEDAVGNDNDKISLTMSQTEAECIFDILEEDKQYWHRYDKDAAKYLKRAMKKIDKAIVRDGYNTRPVFIQIDPDEYRRA